MWDLVEVVVAEAMRDAWRVGGDRMEKRALRTWREERVSFERMAHNQYGPIVEQISMENIRVWWRS
jgi:hypothetical protein